MPLLEMVGNVPGRLRMGPCSLGSLPHVFCWSEQNAEVMVLKGDLSAFGEGRVP